MSYLIIPALLEGGLFTEAKKQLRSVLHFHNNSRSETSEMMSRSFQFRNYMKGLELRDFLRKCECSVQLALARTEVPLLEIVEKVHTSKDAAAYFQQFMIGTFLESHTWLTDSEMDNLSDNCDYDLLVRCDSRCSEELSHKGRRFLQYKRRLSVGQAVLKTLYYAVGINDDIRAHETLQILKAMFNRSTKTELTPSPSEQVCGELAKEKTVDVFAQVMDAAARLKLSGEIASLPDCGKISATSPAGQWSQRIDTGSESFELVVMQAFIELVTLYLELAVPDLNSQADSEIVDKAAVSTTPKPSTRSVDSFIASVQAVRVHIISLNVSEVAEASGMKAIPQSSFVYLPTPTPVPNLVTLSNEGQCEKGKSIDAGGTIGSILAETKTRVIKSQTSSGSRVYTTTPLDPVWLRKISFFVFSLASWAPLVLGRLTSCLPLPTKKTKKKKASKDEMGAASVENLDPKAVAARTALKVMLDLTGFSSIYYICQILN